MTKRQKNNLKRILASTLLVVASLFLRKFTYIRIAVLMLSYSVSGYDVLWSAIRKIFQGHLFDEEILMSVATVGAVLLQEYPEATMVMILYQTGELFQGVAVGKSRKSIKELMKIKPDKATVIRNGQEVIISPKDVQTGETLLVIPGEKVPLDGSIVEGESSFDSSSLTGESVPVFLKKGEKAISGMVNLESPVKVIAESTYGESTVSKILDLVENSAAYKSPSEKFITKFSRRYTPLVFAAAVATSLIPPVFLGCEFSAWVRRALIFLIVSCPCALVISVPLTFFGAIGAASRKGILIKGSEYIEKLSKVSLFAFDKTGTLTEGRFSVVQIHSLSMEEEKLLEIAALAESFSSHPIAYSVIKEFGKEIDKKRVDNVKTVAGKGITATIDKKEVFVGNRQLLLENGFDIPEPLHFGTVVFIACEGKYAGYIVLEDKIKESAKNSLQALKKLGVKRNVMLTGDNRETAEKIGKISGIDEVCSELLPQEKVQRIITLRERDICAFVGDGINDAPVISCADVGFAMGALGSDAAIEAADIVIMNDSIEAISDVIKLSKKTMRIVKENIIFSLAIKFGVMLLSVSGFDNMLAAIFADVGVMIIAILNAMRMMKK